MTTAALCFRLAEADGTSGDESAAAAVAEDLLSAYMETSRDVLGNVCGVLGDGKTKILLDAHIDRVGLVVRGVDEKGFLLVSPVGSPDPRVLVGSEVLVMGDEPLCGVVCSTPPHLTTKEQRDETVEIKDLAVDIGMDKETALQHVSVGDRVVFLPNQSALLGTRIVSSAFDDRCGMAAILKAVELVHDKLKNCTLQVLFSTREEVGGSGAKTGAFTAQPDYAVAVDVGFGADPYCDKTETIPLGAGPSIGISPVLDRALTKQFVSLARENNIPYQHDVMSGRTGTNADWISISKGGVRTALLSIPLRSMHTGVEVIDTLDVDNTAALLAAFILAKEEEA